MVQCGAAAIRVLTALRGRGTARALQDITSLCVCDLQIVPPRPLISATNYTFPAPCRALFLFTFSISSSYYFLSVVFVVILLCTVYYKEKGFVMCRGVLRVCFLFQVRLREIERERERELFIHLVRN